jgi:hypothetical protein
MAASAYKGALVIVLDVKAQVARRDGKWPCSNNMQHSSVYACACRVCIRHFESLT